MNPPWSRRVVQASLAASVLALAGAAIAHLAHTEAVQRGLLIGATVLGIALAVWWVGDDAVHRRVGVDLVALAALVGAFVVGERWAGAVITVMLTTGRVLEGWAAGRAERELHALVSRAPTTAHRRVDGTLVDAPVDEVKVGDLLVVLPGEVLPVDATVHRGPAILDESALTGESLPVTHADGDAVPGGAVNAGGPIELIATTVASASTYAGIVRLVRAATADSAPFVRLADRWGLRFLVLSFTVAGVAWAIAGSLDRAVEVLVVATPCPLILAAPVAIVAGLSRAAARGVVVKGGGPLEVLADATVLLFDKTGTLTAGTPVVVEVLAGPDITTDELLAIAASLDQVSPHVLATAIVRAARARDIELPVPTGTEEVPGAGVRGRVGGREVAVGTAAWAGFTGLEPWLVAWRRRGGEIGQLVHVALEGRPAGSIVLRDPVRLDAARTIRHLRRTGIDRVVMVTGDRGDVARSVGLLVGVDQVDAEQTPEGKVEVVRRETAAGRTMMVGDGINDAPALAIADVGVAIGARGATASSEAADVVLTVDRLDRLGDARLIARRSRKIAREAVILGMALSLVAMAVATTGVLPATAGALVQEVIDVLAIAWALRALRPGPGEVRMDEAKSELARRFTDAHRTLRPDIDVILDAADRLGADPAGAMPIVRRAHRLLVEEVVPHEAEEDRELYPMMAAVLGGTDPMGPMSRTHAEIDRLTTRVGAVVERIGDGVPDDLAVRELQQLLYGLHAVMVLHMAQEDEHYLSLADDRR